MEDSDRPQATFQLVKPIEGNIWLARKVGQLTDEEEFVARKVDDFDEYYDAGKYAVGLTTERQRQIKGLMDLLYDCNLGRNISHIFNHENIISLAGYSRQHPFHAQLDATEDYLVWDLCDGGFLNNLFTDRLNEREPKCFMPESLCWHVLTSIMRALAWLHEGHRQEVNWLTGEKHWVRTDMDWMPILHRNIDGGSIFFQHPRGEELYGVCKLGRFGNAFVSGVPAQREKQYAGETPVPNSIGYPLAPKKGHMDLTSMRKQWKEYLFTRDNDLRLYTLSDDHWALGAAVFRMMTGYRLPTIDGCENCGCIHLRRCRIISCLATEDHGKGCEHPNFRGCQCRPGMCATPGDTHIDETLDRHGYSKYLKLAVRFLLDYDLQCPVVGTKELCERVEILYQKWRNKMDDGKEYIDVMDDLQGLFWEVNGVLPPDGSEETETRAGPGMDEDSGLESE
ncbi:hypothetical protein CTRI78_v005083 [Colletotrichum trifolii]|uniref:Protein kinase domain-containing protein n=1 Tax=Colletotrichum trifolii TaxID=5466 RepID=A0A4R8RFG4_COLTR|nr:hypothetical protein CTRI78_v005083 [Colletotrichum trifolii]